MVVYPDNYWQRRFYFDNVPSLKAFRTAQKEKAFDRIIELADWFARPIHTISEYLYLLAWVTGAGKTHGATAIPFAYNQVILDRCGLAPRANRILILTKERAIRDQLACEFASEIQGFGICTVQPQIALIGETDSRMVRNQPNIRCIDFSALASRNLLDQFDIVVGCLQSFWVDGKKGVPDALSQFPLIFFDELHFGYDRLCALRKAAPHSLCFGLTATPIEASGKLLGGLTRLSTFSYNEAAERDGSVKFLSNEEDKLQTIIQEVVVRSVNIRLGETESTILSPVDIPHHGRNLSPSLVVAREVVIKLMDLDQLCKTVCERPLQAEAADHRPDHISPTLTYPAHAIIVADSVSLAMTIQSHLNDLFDGDRNTYPRQDGWHAEIAHSGFEDAAGRNFDAEPLSPDHPWFLARKTGGSFRDGKKLGSRIVVLIDMGREGINNSYCNVVGVACPIASQKEACQRIIGRPIRAVVRHDANGQVTHCPPRDLDTLHLITHPSFQNREAIVRGINYTVHMEEFLQDIPTVEDIASGKAKSTVPADISTGDNLEMKERLAVCNIIGDLLRQGRKVDTDEVATRVDGGSAKRHDKAREWADLILSSPQSAVETLDLVDSLPVVSVVTHEDASVEPTDDQLITWISRRHRELSDHLGRIRTDPTSKLLARALYQEHRRQLGSLRPQSTTTLETQRRSVVFSILDSLGIANRRGRKEDPQNLIRDRTHSLVGKAVKQLFGCPPESRVSDDSDYNTPYHHAILAHPHYRRLLSGWVRRRLVSEGYFPNLAAALRIPSEEPHG